MLNCKRDPILCYPPSWPLVWTLVCVVAALSTAAQASGPPADLERFVWVGRHVDLREPCMNGNDACFIRQGKFTPGDISAMAPYDTVVIARFHADFDREEQHEEARRIKSAYPAIRVLTYLTGEQRLADATYANCQPLPGMPQTCPDGLPAFRDEWVASCAPDDSEGCGTGATCRNGQLVQEVERTDPVSGITSCVETGRWVDTGDPDYRAWVTEVASAWMALSLSATDPTPVYDGVMFDLAYGSVRTSNRVRERTGCESVPVNTDCSEDCPGFEAPLGQICTTEALFDGLTTLLREVKADPDLAGRLVLYNGLQTNNSYERGACRHDEPLTVATALDPPDGVHNEYFCHHRDDTNGDGIVSNNWQPRCNLLEDLERTWALGQAGHWVLNKANFLQPNILPDAERRAIGSYCYASHLLAHTAGSTSFKLGSATTAPRVLTDEPAERAHELGTPLLGSLPAIDTKFEILPNGLVVRQFENHWVVVNMAEGMGEVFKAPEFLIRAEDAPPAGEPTVFSVGENVLVAGNDAAFLAKDGQPVAGSVSYCADGLSHSRYTAGSRGLDWADRRRASIDAACCDVRTDCTLEDQCFQVGEFAGELAGSDAVCVSAEFGGATYGPTLHACDSSLVGETLTDQASGRELCCSEQRSGGPSEARFDLLGHLDCPSALPDPLPGCQDDAEGHPTNRNHRTGNDFGSDWDSIEVAADFEQFEQCCDPARTCNRNACWSPGTLLPRLRDTDEICAGRVAGGPLGHKPAIYTCDSDNVGELFTHLITSAPGAAPTTLCCTERSFNGHPVYVFDDATHEACSGSVPFGGGCLTQGTNRNSFWGPDLGTDWSRRDPTPTLAYDAPGCCNPSQTCNRGGTCYAPGQLLPRFGVTHEICAEIAPNSSGIDRPAIYRCDENNVGQTLTTPTSAGSVSFCCIQNPVDSATGTYDFEFLPGACS